MADSNSSNPTPNPETSLPPQAGSEIGSSGTYFFKGFITAEEYNIDLQGKYALQVYDVMRKSDSTIHAALLVCKQPILGADWGIDPASEDPIDQEIAERINRELFDRKIVFSDLLREVMTFLDFGFFIAEEVYAPTTYQGKTYIGIEKIASRKQRSILKFEQDDGTPGITQIIPAGGMVNIPREKLLYVVNDQEGENYYGVSMLRYAYKPWKIKDGLEIMNAIALENMALGVPYIKKGLNGITVDEPELEAARDRLRQQRVNEEAFLEFPASLEIGWMDMKGNSTKDVMPTIKYQDSQILLSVLAQFLLLGSQDSGGSRAVSADHSRLFVKALEAVARIARDAIQRDVINRWVDLNYSNLQNGYPKLSYSGISDEDVQTISAAVAALMTAGAILPSSDIENRMRQLLNLPELTQEDVDGYEDKVEKNKPAPPVFAPGVPAGAAGGADPTPSKDKETNPSSDVADKGSGADKTKAMLQRAKAIQREMLGAIAEG
jgi:hypothetical protein